MKLKRVILNLMTATHLKNIKGQEKQKAVNVSGVNKEPFEESFELIRIATQYTENKQKHFRV